MPTDKMSSSETNDVKHWFQNCKIILSLPGSFIHTHIPYPQRKQASCDTPFVIPIHFEGFLSYSYQQNSAQTDIFMKRGIVLTVAKDLSDSHSTEVTPGVGERAPVAGAEAIRCLPRRYHQAAL